MFKKLSICSLLIIMFQLCSISNIIAGVKDRIGGSGNENPQSSNNSNTGKTLLYVAGGLVAAFVVYTIISDKIESAAEESDSTEALLLKPLSDRNSDFTSQLLRYQEKIPIDIIMDINTSTPYTNDRRFLVGLRFKL